LKVELYRALRAEGKSRADLQRAMKVHRPQIDRLLDLNHASKLDQIEAAFRALGREVNISVEAA
jgi:antitoxin HicB